MAIEAREIARETVTACYAKHEYTSRGACDLCITAALARVEREALERACNAVCMGCERGWPVVRQTGGALALYHAIPAGVREDGEDEHLYCEAEEIRALASGAAPAPPDSA